jgi:hypothetical protein
MTEVMTQMEHHIPLMVEPQLMMMAISGLVLNKNILSWTKHFYL